MVPASTRALTAAHRQTDALHLLEARPQRLFAFSDRKAYE